MSESPPGRYKIKTIAELCGFTPNLLRAWENRYDLLHPVRQPSGHRLYTDDDLKLLRRIRRLIDDGQSIGEIAALGREALLAWESPWESQPHPVEGSCEEMLQAALTLDGARLEKALDRLESLPRSQSLQLLRQTLQEMGTLWAHGQASVASEHLLSQTLGTRLRFWMRQIQGGENLRQAPVLCAGFPDEQHEIGLLMAAYELRYSGYPVVYLGAGVPFLDLERAIEASRPEAVALSVTRTALFEIHRHDFAELVRRHPEISFVVGGAGVGQMESELAPLSVIVWPQDRSLTSLSRSLS